MKILYWDDSETVLENVTRKLERLQHTVVPAKTMDECKEALANREHPVDLFIADHSIDEKNGMTFIMGAKAADPELHVVVLTPAILRSEFNQLQMSGIDVLKKPILIDQVVRPYLAPGMRRKKKPAPTGETAPRADGLLGLAAQPAPSARPEGMPPPPANRGLLPPENSPSPGLLGSSPPKPKKKGLTRLFSRGH